MKKRGSESFRKASGGLAGLALLLVILVAVNVVLGNVRLRADLTGEKLYTLSDGTRGILKKLDRTVTLKFFFNSSAREVPTFLKSHARQVEDLLAEYRLAAGGRLVLEKYDPEPDSDAEEWAQQYGLAGRALGLTGPTVYLGLVATAGDNEAVLPLLDPRAEAFLEYNITRLIYRVVHPEKSKVGILSSLPVLGTRTPPFAMPGQPPPQPESPWVSFRELREDYDLQEIPDTAEEIAADLDACVVVHPKGFSDKLLYALDQFVLRGGRLLVFLDPLCISDPGAAAGPYGMGEASSNLDPLLAAWGIGFNTETVVADLRVATRVRAAENRVEDSPVWLSLTPDHVDRKDILTADLESILLPLAGAFDDNTGEELTVAPLLTSSEAATTVQAMAARFGGDMLRRELTEGSVPLDLAVRVSGTFRTAFPDGKPAGDPNGAAAETDETDRGEGAEPIEAGTGLSEGDSTVILVGDADLLADPFCVREMNFFGFTSYQPIDDNIAFLANAVEQLAGSSDLIGIRSRGRFSLPFDRVVALEERARSEWQARENELVQKLEQAQQQLNELQGQKDENQRFILSDRQKRAITRFREEEARIKRDLKDVRKNLRRDIERLGITVKVINIVLMPVVVSLTGVCLALHRRRRR